MHLLIILGDNSMGLNDIRLQQVTIEEWYKDALVPGSNSNWGEFAAITPAPIPPQEAKAAPASDVAESKAAPTPQQPAPSVKTAPALKHLGNNRRHITIIVQSTGSPFLPDDQLTVLTKILEACRMTLADVAIINHTMTPKTIAEIRQNLQAKTVLLFGPEPAAIKLPINFPVFKPIDYDACKFLAAPALEHFVPATEESKLLKSKLWVCLKTIFEV